MSVVFISLGEEIRELCPTLVVLHQNKPGLNRVRIFPPVCHPGESKADVQRRTVVVVEQRRKLSIKGTITVNIT